MTTIPAEKIADVRDRVDIERVVGRSVRLQRKGRRAWGLCPFHKEKSPSFAVDSDKKLFHCFGCKAGGDVFAFVMRIEGIEFKEAVLLLAKEVGVEIADRDEDPRERETRQRRERMLEVNRIAAAFYQARLQADPRALAYLREARGLTDATIAQFQLGYAPPEWTALADHLQKRRVDPRLAVTVGLLKPRPKDGTLYDALRGRIIFPIVLPTGDIAGFGARRSDWLPDQGETPKYLNSPESPVYDKSGILYGMRDAKDEIRRGRRAVLVEGYVDVIGLHQAGAPIAVAACGTALSPRHAAMLKRLADEVVALYDGDAAGQDAARKTAEILLKEGVKVRIATLPEGEDPDTFARGQGTEAVLRLLDEAPSAIDFFVGKARRAYQGGGIAGMASAVEAVKPLLLSIADPLERDVCIDASARTLGIDRAVLRRHLAAHASPAPRPMPVVTPPPAPAPKATAPIETFEMEILKRLVEAPQEVLDALESHQAADAFSHPAIHAAILAGSQAFREGKPFDAPRALEAATASGQLDERGVATLRRTLMEPLPEQHSLEVCVKRLLKKKNAIRLRHLQQQAARETDPEKLTALAEEVVQLNRILASLT